MGKKTEKIQTLHSRIANCRKDFLHKAFNQISKNHAMIAIEDLRVSNMSRSAKGTAEKHGRNVKAKSGLIEAPLAEARGASRFLFSFS
ncbi:transposase [Candidatus Enterovibrio escicola]|uniref:transposase n=1 Tax=Candidatus Enterovibrio escicola TaxID=1927127 RepID=UPI0021DFCCCB|nr:transposase [Candidatus Enterovibrio escacola]